MADKEHKVIKIASADPPKEVGSKGARKVSFKDTGNLRYDTFEAQSFNLLVSGATIEADVETKVTPKNGKDYVDRLVSNIVLKEAAPAGTTTTINPETMSCKDKSIEAQVAFKGAIDLLIGGAIDREDPFVKAAFEWGKRALGLSLCRELGKKPVPDPVMVPETKPETPPQPAQPPASQPLNKPELTYEKLRDEAQKLGWTDVGMYISQTFGVKGKNVKEVFDQLNAAQRANLSVELEGRKAKQQLFPEPK